MSEIISMEDISIQASIEAYFAHMFGGMLRKIGCKIRPYEKEKGMTDKVIAQSLNILYNTLLGGRNKDDDVAKVISLFKKIETIPEKRPKVAIFGDLYARDNDVFNQDLIHCIEEYGGEVITTPFNEFAKIIANPYMRRWFLEGEFLDVIYTKTLIALVNQLEKSYYKLFNELLDEPSLGTNIDYKEIYDVFDVKVTALRRIRRQPAKNCRAGSPLPRYIFVRADQSRFLLCRVDYRGNGAAH